MKFFCISGKAKYNASLVEFIPDFSYYPLHGKLIFISKNETLIINVIRILYLGYVEMRNLYNTLSNIETAVLIY